MSVVSNNKIPNKSGAEINKQLNTFHTPSFGDEEFDVSPLNHHVLHTQDDNHLQDAAEVLHHMEQSSQQHQSYLHNDPHHQQHLHHSGMDPPLHHSTMSAIGDDQQYLWSGSHVTTEQQQQQQQQQQSQYYHNEYSAIVSQNPSVGSHQYHGQYAEQVMVNNHHQQPSTQNITQMHQHMLMMPPPQKSPLVTSPTSNFVGQSPHHHGGGYTETTSDDSDDSGLRLNPLKMSSPEPSTMGGSSPKALKSTPGGTIPMGVVKKPKVQRKKKKKDPNEPQKPVSAYALFFRDTQAAIKGQNPTASFGEVSTIVASMWDVLAPEHKDVYKKKTEAAKKEYLKTLAAYRASLVSKGSDIDQPQQPQQQQSPQPLPVAASSPAIQSPPLLSQQQQQHQSQPFMHSSPPAQQAQQQQHGGFQQQFVNSYKSPNQIEYQQQSQLLHPQQVNQNHQYQSYGNEQSHSLHSSHIMGLDNNPYMTGSGQSHLQNHHPPIHQHQIHQSATQNIINHNNHQMIAAGTGPANNNGVPVSSSGPGGNMPNMMYDQQPQSMPPPSSSHPSNHSQQPQPQPQHISAGPPPIQKCIRHGCTNQAIVNSDWEDEYCSNECVISHCRNVFRNYIQTNGKQQQSC